MIHEQFYKELGKLLYAIALSDGFIQPAEIKELERIVYDELTLVHAGDYKDIILTKLSFYESIREHAGVKKSYQSFKEFMYKNGEMIDDHEQMIAKKLIHRVTDAYKGENKAEKKLVEEILSVMSLKRNMNV